MTDAHFPDESNPDPAYGQGFPGAPLDEDYSAYQEPYAAPAGATDSSGGGYAPQAWSGESPQADATAAPGWDLTPDAAAADAADTAAPALYHPTTGNLPLVVSDASYDDTGEIGPPIGAVVPETELRPPGVGKHDPPGTQAPAAAGLPPAIVADLPRTRTAALRAGFWWPSDRPVGVLMLHEFASTPEGLVQIADVLHAEGIWSVAPVLPGHDNLREPQRLAHTTVDDMILCADEWFTALSAHVPAVLVVGCGLGGSLALLTAQRHADTVTGLVTIGTPARTYARRNLRVRLTSAVTRMAPGPGPDVKDVGAAEAMFDVVPAPSFHTMVGLERAGLAAADGVRAPTLLFHSRDDHVVARADASTVYAALGSASKELVWLERSFHRGWIDHDAPLIAERLVRFADALEERTRALHAWGAARR